MKKVLLSITFILAIIILAIVVINYNSHTKNNYYISKHSNIHELIDKIGSNEATITVDCAYNFSTGTNFPKNILLDFIPGGVFSIKDGVSVSISNMLNPQHHSQIFAGALPIFSGELAIPVKPEWFSSNNDKYGFFSAIAACPPGGTVGLENKSYNIYGNMPITSKDVITKANIKIEGTGMPLFREDGTGLEIGTGTIIIGPLQFERPVGVTVRNLGVDSGSTVCTKYFGGIAQEGFSMANSDYTPVKKNYGKNVLVENIAVITQKADAIVHSFLFEGLDYSTARNIKSRNGLHGFVIKATNSDIENIEIKGSGANGMFVLSSEYALCNNIKVKNVKISDGGGLHIRGGKTPVKDITLSGFTINNTIAAGILIDSSNYSLNNVLIDDCNISGSATDGIKVINSEVFIIKSSIINSEGFGLINIDGDVFVDQIKYEKNAFGDNEGTIRKIIIQ